MTEPQQAECERLVEHATSRDPTVKFMVEKMTEVGGTHKPLICKVLLALHSEEQCSQRYSNF